jgi:FAD:protein FMN transferase
MPSASRINGSEPVYSSFRFGALGTQWEIATGEPLDDGLRQLILKRIDDFERTYSRFRDDSLVAHIAAAHDGGRFLFPEDSTVLFDLYDRLHEATAGAVDPLVGRRLEVTSGQSRTQSGHRPDTRRPGPRRLHDTPVLRAGDLRQHLG